MDDWVIRLGSMEMSNSIKLPIYTSFLSIHSTLGLSLYSKINKIRLTT